MILKEEACRLASVLLSPCEPFDRAFEVVKTDLYHDGPRFKDLNGEMA